MVLAELGSSISNAIQNLTRAPVVDEEVFKHMLTTISKALLAADVEFPLVAKVQKGIKARIDLTDPAIKPHLKRLIHQAVVSELYALLDSGTKPYQLKKNKTNVVMFVGLQGAGKTTTVTKFAHYYQRKGWKTGLICADTYRAGAFDQLKQNATKARIAFYGSYTEIDPVVVVQAGLEKFKNEKYDLIIIDTSGRHKQEAALFEEMQEISRVATPDDVVFVMDGSIGKSAKEQAMAFRTAVDVGSVIITKLDGHAKGGGALSAIAATKSPIIFIGTGEHITDLESFNTQSFVSRLLGMGDIGGLIELVQDADIIDSQQQLVSKLTSKNGVFTIRDLNDQFKNILKLGPISQLMNMMPDIGLPKGKDQEKEASHRMKQFLTILDSMNNKELDGDGKIFIQQPQRIERVADGSGTSDDTVKMVLQSYTTMAKMMGQVGNLAKGMDMSKMSKMMGAGGAGGMPDPAMLQQLMGAMGGGGGPGGAGGGMMQQMMQMMGGMGGMPGMGGGQPTPQQMQQMQSMMKGMGMQPPPQRRR